MKKILIIGSGISGLSIANLLKPNFQVEILEKDSKIGGLIKCERIDGILFHRVGGHVFNSKNIEVLEWFWNFFDQKTEFINAKRKAKILLNNKLIGYPLENHIFQLEEKQVKVILEELLNIYKLNKNEDQVLISFEKFLIAHFGETLCNLYFLPYNNKIWNTDLSKVPLPWLEGKLPMPIIYDILISNIIKKEETTMVHSTFYYPKVDGSQFIVNRLANNLNIKTSYNIFSIFHIDGKLVVNDGERIVDSIIFTGDVRRLNEIVKISDIKLKRCLNKAESLLSNGTSNVLCETDDTDLSWLYLPEKSIRAHRIIYTGNFSSSNNFSNRKSCVVEFSGKLSENEITKDLEKLPGNLKPISFNYEPNSYIIQNENTRNIILELKNELIKYNIFLLGRFAEWEYYNMDKCIESAMLLSKNISNNKF